MLYYAAVYLIVAVIAGAFAFGATTASVTEIARILFVLFLIMALVSVFVHFTSRR